MPVDFMQTVRFASDTLNITNQAPNSLLINLPAPTGFSALIAGRTVSGSTQFADWQIISPPRFNFGGFNPITGIFTVPSTGIYSVKATIFYMLSAIPVLSLNANFPLFTVRNVNSAAGLVTGLLPVLHMNAGGAVGELRAILDAATVTLADDLLLIAGDNIALYYEPDGLNIPLLIGNRSPGIVWSVLKLSDA
jgi:hypothetical protein